MQFQEQKFRKKVSPSQQRRRDRRAAARVVSEENVGDKVSEKDAKTMGDTDEEKFNDKKAFKTDEVNLNEEDDNVAVSEPKDVAEEAEDEDKLDMDFDLYISTFWTMRSLANLKKQKITLIGS